MPTTQKQVDQFIAREKIHGISISLGNCPECDVPFTDLRVCPKCWKDADEFTNEPFISRRDCACCGDSQQGERVEMIAMAPAPKGNKAHSVQKTFIICTDCEAAIGKVI